MPKISGYIRHTMLDPKAGHSPSTITSPLNEHFFIKTLRLCDCKCLISPLVVVQMLWGKSRCFCQMWDDSLCHFFLSYFLAIFHGLYFPTVSPTLISSESSEACPFLFFDDLLDLQHFLSICLSWEGSPLFPFVNNSSVCLFQSLLWWDI